MSSQSYDGTKSSVDSVSKINKDLPKSISSYHQYIISFSDFLPRSEKENITLFLILFTAYLNIYILMYKLGLLLVDKVSDIFKQYSVLRIY